MSCRVIGWRPVRSVLRSRACIRSYQIYFCVGVSHIADDAAILHPVQMFPGHHVFVTWVGKQLMGSWWTIWNGEIMIWGKISLWYAIWSRCEALKSWHSCIKTIPLKAMSASGLALGNCIPKTITVHFRFIVLILVSSNSRLWQHRLKWVFEMACALCLHCTTVLSALYYSTALTFYIC